MDQKISWHIIEIQEPGKSSKQIRHVCIKIVCQWKLSIADIHKDINIIEDPFDAREIFFFITRLQVKFICGMSN